MKEQFERMKAKHRERVNTLENAIEDLKLEKECQKQEIERQQMSIEKLQNRVTNENNRFGQEIEQSQHRMKEAEGRALKVESDATRHTNEADQRVKEAEDRMYEAEYQVARLVAEAKKKEILERRAIFEAQALEFTQMLGEIEMLPRQNGLLNRQAELLLLEEETLH